MLLRVIWSRICCASCRDKAAAFDVTDRKTTTIPSVAFRLQGKEVVRSRVILETQAAWNLPSTTVNCYCSAVTMPI